MTSDELAGYRQQAREAKRRAEKATPNRWAPYFTVHGDPYVVDVDRPFPTSRVVTVSVAPDDYGRSNAQFIAAARSDVPIMADAIEALADIVERQRAALKGVTQRSPWVADEMLRQSCDFCGSPRGIGHAPECVWANAWALAYYGPSTPSEPM